LAHLRHWKLRQYAPLKRRRTSVGLCRYVHSNRCEKLKSSTVLFIFLWFISDAFYTWDSMASILVCQYISQHLIFDIFSMCWLQTSLPYTHHLKIHF
jgi:hypothetical protein